MSKVLLTFRVPPGDEAPALDDVLQQLALDRSEIDPEYGVQMVDPTVGDWVLLVEEPAARRVAGHGLSAETFSDVRIETMGPPPAPEDI